MNNHRNPFKIELKTNQRLGVLAPAAGSATRLTIYKQSIKSLPLPATLWNAYQQACQRDASNQEIAKIIKSDPVLAAAILGNVNTAGFGLRTPINDIGRAISHLGHSLTRSIVAHHSFSSALPIKGKITDVSMLWKTSMLVAALAEIVARHIPG